MRSFSGVVSELRRRHVFRVAVVYAIVAWGLLEVGDLVFPALGLPEWPLTLLVVLALFGLPIAIVLAWAFDLTPTGVVRTSQVDHEAREVVGEAGSEEAVGDGIVVLPFENLSPNPEDEYFSDGVTDDLITQLYRVGSLRVISRTSAWQYKAAPAGAKQIAADLGVAYLLEGSVRRSGTRVRIVAQLIDARSDQHVWAESYDRELEDIFAIQAEVADRIASALQVTLSGESTVVPRVADLIGTATDRESHAEIEDVPTSDLEAYDLYLRGRYLWNRRSETALDESVSHLSGAIARDPDFVRARSALAEAYVTQAIYGYRAAGEVLPLARVEADQALARDPTEAPALSALACVRAIYHWEWARAEAGFESAMKANPQYPTAPQWLAMNVFVPNGRFEEALDQLERARELDPMCPSVRASFGVVEFMRGDYGQAAERFQLLLGQDPSFMLAHFFRGLTALYSGDSSGALGSLEKALELGRWSPEGGAALGCALVAAGREADARAILDRLLGHIFGDREAPPELSELRGDNSSVRSSSCGESALRRVQSDHDIEEIH